MVKVQIRQSGSYGGFKGAWPEWHEVEDEANRGCSKYDKAAEFMSKRCVLLSPNRYRQCEVMEYLFVCS